MGDTCACTFFETVTNLDPSRHFAVASLAGEVVDQDGQLSGGGTALTGLLLADISYFHQRASLHDAFAAQNRLIELIKQNEETQSCVQRCLEDELNQ